MSFTGSNQIHHCSQEQAKPMTETPKAILGDQSDDQSRIQLIASKDIAALGSYLVSDRILSSSVKLQKSEYFFVENMPHNYAFGRKKSIYFKHCPNLFNFEKSVKINLSRRVMSIRTG